jgi:hypothetical protein
MLFVISKPGLIETVFGQTIIALANLFTASVFMFLMGINLALTKRSALRDAFKRGMILLIIGYVLNLLRGVIPVWIGIKTGHYTLSDIAPQTPLSFFKEVDILQWAGISIIFIALVKRILMFSISGIVVGTIILIGASFVYGYELPVPLLWYVSEMLWGTKEYVFFPILPWIVYALFGLSYGYFYQGAENKEQFFKVTAYIGTILFLSGLIMLFNDSTFTPGRWLKGDYLQGVIPAGLIVCQSGFILIWLLACHQIIEKVSFNKYFELLCFWSQNVTVFYFIQWVLIGWIVIFRQQLDVEGTILYTIIVLYLTHTLISVWVKQRS